MGPFHIQSTKKQDHPALLLGGPPAARLLPFFGFYFLLWPGGNLSNTGLSIYFSCLLRPHTCWRDIPTRYLVARGGGALPGRAAALDPNPPPPSLSVPLPDLSLSARAARALARPRDGG